MLHRSLIDNQVFEKIIKAYNSYDGINKFQLQIEGCWHIKEILMATKSMVVHDKNWQGFLIVFFGQSTIYLNPWFFGGKPIGNKYHINQQRFAYLEEAKEIFRCSKYEKMLLLAETNSVSITEQKVFREAGLHHQYDYANMVLEIEPEQPKEIDIRHNLEKSVRLEDVRIPDKMELVSIFHQSFRHSDARFYGNMTPEEREQFFDELGYEQATLNPYSRALYLDQALIGFSLVYELEEKGLQISCMCIVPEFIHKGFGRILLKHIIDQAIANKIHNIFLGTETTMSAYNMYQHFGFKTIKTVSFFLLKTF